VRKREPVSRRVGPPCSGSPRCCVHRRASRSGTPPEPDRSEGADADDCGNRPLARAVVYQRWEQLLATEPILAMRCSSVKGDASTPRRGHWERRGRGRAELAADIVEVPRDRITARIAEECAGHGLPTLRHRHSRGGGLLLHTGTAGAGRGIDITAGRGPLGLDSPRLLVRVKSGAQIGSPVVTQLHGVMSTHGADHGRLVALEDCPSPARDGLKNQRLRVRIWEAADVVDAVLRIYDRLPDQIRANLPCGACGCSPRPVRDARAGCETARTGTHHGNPAVSGGAWPPRCPACRLTAGACTPAGPV
jgi:hypothetical protein